MSAKQYVFDALEQFGDQTSIEFLQKEVNVKFVDCRLEAIGKKQDELIGKTGLTSEVFWELYHDHPELLEVKWANIVRLFDKTVERYSRASEGVNYSQLYNYRLEWRKEKAIERDCRTYIGQPDRNMVRNAA